MEKDFLLEAIINLSNGSPFSMGDRDIDAIEWIEEDFVPPTKNEILLKIAELEQEYSRKAYKDLRKLEYPDFMDYLDGIVKGDQEQIDAYIAACQAVKAKYPKPV